MVMKMNKKEFINELSRKLTLSIEKCVKINDILESHFFISKKSKDRIIEELINEFSIEKEEAIHIYMTAVKIVKDEVRNKLKHPFLSQD